MGCGKSTHGKKLAKVLRRTFIDLDVYISKEEGISVEEIFAEKGEDYFRQKESDNLNKINNQTSKLVISLGGGTVCFNNNLNKILNAGLVIYIKMPAEALHKRLINSKTQRPLLQNKNSEESLEYIKKLLEKREQFYNKAHLTINGIDLTTDKLKEAVSLFIAKH